jgi:acyl-coenzyme A thioesterase PaaI-like protein
VTRRSVLPPAAVSLRMIPRRLLLWLARLYPPFLGAGIRVRVISEGFRHVEVDMPLHRWNRNAVGTHFGGSLFAMTDPFFMLMLLNNLGPEYIVWDKAASIRFRKPGRGTVHARFVIDQALIDEVRAEANTLDKVERTLSVDITDAAGNVVAEVERLVYIRRKNRDSLGPRPRR